MGLRFKIALVSKTNVKGLPKTNLSYTVSKNLSIASAAPEVLRPHTDLNGLQVPSECSRRERSMRFEPRAGRVSPRQLGCCDKLVKSVKPACACSSKFGQDASQDKLSR